MSNIQRFNFVGEEEEPTEHEPFWTPHFYDPSSPAAITYIPHASIGEFNPVTIPYDLFAQDTRDKIYNNQRRPPHARDIGHMLVHYYSAPQTTTQWNEIPFEAVESIIDELIQNRETIDEDDRDDAIEILEDELAIAAEDINSRKRQQQQERQNPVRRI